MAQTNEQRGWEATRVPARLLLPYIEKYAKRKDSSLDRVCSDLGISGKRKKNLQDGKMVPFDMADRIICFVANGLFTWQNDAELHDVYQGLDLALLDQYVPVTSPAYGRCQRPGCATKLVTAKRGHGKKYCSTACRQAVQRARRQERRGVPQRYASKWDTCLKGHDRSPENIYYAPDGSIKCRACNRERENERYATSPEHAERKRQYMREYRARKKAEEEAA